MYTYMDHDGTQWSAAIDPRSVRKEGKVTLAHFCVLCPMPSYRASVPVLKASAKLKPHSAKES